MGGFWRSRLGALVTVVLLAAVVLSGAVGVQVWRVTHPRRETGPSLEFASKLVPIEPVRFPASDGIQLSGWLVRGAPGAPPVLLCHDLGAEKGSLLNLAIALQKRGLTALAIDFRGHGESGGAGSTLGVAEKRDVIGAVDWLSRLDGVDTRRVGVYGVGLGAHAAVLAAGDRPALRVLVLDGIYPDASDPLVRKAYGGWAFAVRWLSGLPRFHYLLTNRFGTGSERAIDVLPRLEKRELLFLAAETDGPLGSTVRRIYEAVPERRETEKNLWVLPATMVTGLYGAQAEQYHEKVSQFLRDRLD